MTRSFVYLGFWLVMASSMQAPTALGQPQKYERMRERSRCVEACDTKVNRSFAECSALQAYFIHDCKGAAQDAWRTCRANCIKQPATTAR